jgi:hypothetical protein
MYLNKRALKELKRTLFKKPTLGRLATTATLVVPNYTGFRQAVSVLRRLDDVLYPGYREQRIERPVFIFANPRSGTTLTHRLMSMDDAEFTTVKLYQTILTSITATKAIEGLIGLSDTRVGARLRQIYDWLNAPFAKRWQGVHELSLSQPEEDECTFLFALQSPTAALLLPFIDDLEQQIWLDRQDPKERQAFLDDYESTIKRHVYAAGGKRFLNKNVFFATRIQAMYQKFPDATFVYLIRNPYDSLPSFLNMFYRGWVSHSPNIPPDGEEIEALKQLGYEYYRYALRCREQIPSKQFLLRTRRQPSCACMSAWGWRSVKISKPSSTKRWSPTGNGTIRATTRSSTSASAVRKFTRSWPRCSRSSAMTKDRHTARRPQNRSKQRNNDEPEPKVKASWPKAPLLTP